MNTSMRSGPMRSPSLPSRGALINAATPGTEAISPLINARLWVTPAKSRTYSVRIGAIEPVAIWMIMVVTNRLSTSFGFFSEANTCFACSMSRFCTGVNCSLTYSSVSAKQTNSTAAVI
ncbi:Uncharacterised protein [Acinetobacter baumannii]|nr:Uncharacterised protein [Acinetobacter baumannii]